MEFLLDQTDLYKQFCPFCPPATRAAVCRRDNDSSHILTLANGRNPPLKKNFQPTYFCSVFVRVLPPTLPIATFANKTRMEPNMSYDTDSQNEPVCRFGPGRDYVSIWPPEPVGRPVASPNSLTKVLSSIAEIMATFVGSQPRCTAALSAITDRPTERIRFPKETKLHASDDRRADSTTDPAPAANTTGNSGLSTEPTLFPDDSGSSIRIRHKPKHSVRAHRRTAKKRSALSLPGQGSLFDIDFTSARTA